MKLIADSGSTKTDWIFTKNGVPTYKVTTKGINPFYQNIQQIKDILQKELLPNLKYEIPSSLVFYGAGCLFKDKQDILTRAFKDIWGFQISITLNSDIIGAARSLFGNNAGIACILGTGSNSCHWNGYTIENNVPPLGYILGDEGSGAVLGKLLISNLLKNQLPKELSQKFYSEHKITYEELMANVYKNPFPNRNLAQYTYFINKNIHEESMHKIVYESFISFVRRNLDQYPKHLTVGAVGSVAIIFKTILIEVLQQEGYIVGNFIKSPIHALVKYHS